MPLLELRRADVGKPAIHQHIAVSLLDYIYVMMAHFGVFRIAMTFITLAHALVCRAVSAP